MVGKEITCASYVWSCDLKIILFFFFLYLHSCRTCNVFNDIPSYEYYLILSETDFKASTRSFSVNFAIEFI